MCANIRKEIIVNMDGKKVTGWHTWQRLDYFHLRKLFGKHNFRTLLEQCNGGRCSVELVPGNNNTCSKCIFLYVQLKRSERVIM